MPGLKDRLKGPTENQIKCVELKFKNYAMMKFKTTKKRKRKDSIRITFDLSTTTLQAGIQSTSTY